MRSQDSTMGKTGRDAFSPVMISPGATSRVPLTIAGSARFMSRPRMLPSSFSKPALTRRLAEKAPMGPSCPVSRVN